MSHRVREDQSLVLVLFFVARGNGCDWQQMDERNQDRLAFTLMSSISGCIELALSENQGSNHAQTIMLRPRSTRAASY